MDIDIISRTTLKPLVHFYDDFVIFVSLHPSFCDLLQMASKLQVEDILKNKSFQSIQDQHKRNFSSRWSQLLSYQYVMEFDPR